MSTDPNSTVPLPKPTPPEQHRFHFLDLLRGVAAILIVFYHAPQYSHALYFSNSFMAVDFFFCLSGFIIAFSYEARLATRLSFTNFTVARIIRLYPVAILGTLIGAGGALFLHSGIASQFSASAWVAALGLNLLLLPYIPFASTKILIFPFDAPMWSLFAEMLANLVYAALVRLRLAGTSVLGAIAALALVGVAIKGHRQGDISFGHLAGDVHGGLLRVALSFFLGVLLYRLYKRRSPRDIAGVAALGLGAVITAAFIASLANSAVLLHTTLAELAQVCLFFPLVVYLGASVRLPGVWARICTFFGVLSYPLYVLHAPILWMRSVENFIHAVANMTNRGTPVLIAFVVLLVAVVWCIAQFCDAPVRQGLTRWYRSRQSAHGTPHTNGPEQTVPPGS